MGVVPVPDVSDATVSPNVRDYGNEPFFIKKADESKEFLEKHGFPDRHESPPIGRDSRQAFSTPGTLLNS